MGVTCIPSPRHPPLSQRRFRALFNPGVSASLLTPVFIILALLMPASSGGYVTYYSGDDLILSTSGSSVSVARNLQCLVYGNLTEDFSTSPFSTAESWCVYNGWSCAGSCPCWPGSLSLTVTPDGNLQWHNWFHTIGGAVYDFRMWKDIDPVGSDFELYVPISLGRADWQHGIGGSPTLHMYLTLYDIAGVKLFSTDAAQDFAIRRLTASFYGGNTFVSLYSSGLNYKLWQNFTGAYFSYDNGTSVMAIGKFYTAPAKVEIRFYIWEHNDLQPYSDYEYWINIDRVTLVPAAVATSVINFNGLTAGSWCLINSDGTALANSTVNNGGVLSYGSMMPVNGTLIGLCDYAYAKRGVFYANTTVTYQEEGNYFALTQTPSQTVLTINGVPANDIVKVYQGSTLKKTVTSNGSPILVSMSEIPQPFNGSIVVVSRPYLHSAATYSSTLDWNDRLTYSGGTLTRSSTEVQLQQTSTGSEGSSTSRWILTYNLVTGGTTPTLSSWDGYVRFDEQYLYSNDNWNPTMEAWYYLEYQLGASGKNFTVSVSSDGYFHYWAAAGKILQSWGQILLYYVQGSTWTLIAQSGQSETPALTTTVTNISSSIVDTIDKIVVVLHTKGMSRYGYALYNDQKWGRVDYLRINYSKVPDGYPGISVIGLQPAWQTLFGSSTYWANSSGVATIPVGSSTWPSNSYIAVYPPSECYTGGFGLGAVYYPSTTKTFTPATDTIYYEVSTTEYSYRVELTLLSTSILAGKSGTTCTINFTYLVYDNGTLRERGAPAVYINGLLAAVTRSSSTYSTSFSTPGNVQYVNFSSVDGTSIRLACRLKVTK